LDDRAQLAIISYLNDLIQSDSAVMSIDLNLQYAVRLLAERSTEETSAVLSDLYDATDSEAIRRDILIVMARWRNWIWLSDRRAYFRSMRPMERRAYLIASYTLRDEGKHWRDHTKDEFSPFEIIVRDWAASKAGRPNWDVPL